MKNKKRALQFLILSIFFAFIAVGVSGFSDTVFAQPSPNSLGGAATNNAAALAGLQNSDNSLDSPDNIFVKGIKYLLYIILRILVSLVQVGASVFAWATKPEYISGPTGLLNLESVYTLWKFIRDFFNLFFIFLLLFSAFATVFQVEQFSLKKNFPKIILAAIAINFSFPLTRLIIDFGNVPMYFFANLLVNNSGAGNALYSIPSAFFSSSSMGDILALPDPSENGTLMKLLTAVIFTFIFMITLFTLAILFVIRLLKLVILLIFSPFGVAASIVPGLAKFGKQWWSQLLSTVFFGPAAMLMIVVALRFTLELNGESTNSGTAFTQGLGTTAPSANPQSQSSIISQGVFFIPIILMWMAMHLGNKFGIEGAGAVIGKADKVAAWGKKKALGVAKYPWTNAPMRGLRKGVNKRAYEGRLFGDKVKGWTGGYLGAKAWKEGSQNTEAKMAGFVDKGSKGADLERRKAENRRISEKMKEFKDDLLEREDLENKLLTAKSETERKAAALSLAESKEGIKKKPEVLKAALKEFSDSYDYEKFEKILKSADDDAIGMERDQFSAVIDDPKVLEMYKKAKSVATLAEAREELIIDFGKQAKKVGGDIDKLFEYQTGKYFNPTQPGQQKITDTEIAQLYNEHKLTTKDLSQQSTLLRNTDFQNLAKQNFTISEANELAKFVAQNNKNADVKVIVEDIKDTVSRRGNVQGGGAQQNPQQQAAGQGGGNQQNPPGQNAATGHQQRMAQQANQAAQRNQLRNPRPRP